MFGLLRYENDRFNLALDFPQVSQYVICIFLGIILATFFLFTLPTFVLAITGGILLFIFSVYKPEIGILVIIIIISSVVYEAALPLIPIPIGSFHITDVLLLVLLGMIPFKLFTDRNFRLFSTPLDKPLLLFYLAVLISACNSIIFSKLDFNIVMRHFRLINYYLIYFVITNLIREKRQIKFIIKGLFVIATLVGIFMIIQTIVGESFQLMPGRLEQAETLGQIYKAVRLIPPGTILIFVVFLTTVCAITFANKPLLKSSYFYILLVVGTGILFTYWRSYWISIIFSLSICMIMISKRGKKRLLAWFVITVILMSVLSFTFISIGGRPRENLASISDRFTSLFTGERILYSDTLEWRKIEYEYALRNIVKYPLFGIGLAKNYRPYVFGAEDWYYWYIHNGFLWIILKIGLIGFLPFIWFYIRFLIRGFSNWKIIEDVVLKSAVTGFLLSGVGILLIAIIEPLFMQWYAIVMIATMFGLTEAIIRINNSEVTRRNG